MRKATQIAEVLEPEVGDGADAGAGVGQGAEERLVADTGGLGQVEGGQEGPGLAGGDLGGLAVVGGARRSAHGLEGVEEDGVAGDEEIEESPERRQGEPLVGRRGREPPDEACGDPGGDPGELDVPGLAPGEEAEHPAAVGGPGVGVAELGAEELVGREAGAGSGAV